MKNKVFTGLYDAKGRKLYGNDFIRFTYADEQAEGGFNTITGQIVFEKGAFVVKEVEFTGYDWKNDSTRPMLLWDWLRDERCFKVQAV